MYIYAYMCACVWCAYVYTCERKKEREGMREKEKTQK